MMLRHYAKTYLGENINLKGKIRNLGTALFYKMLAVKPLIATLALFCWSLFHGKTKTIKEYKRFERCYL